MKTQIIISIKILLVFTVLTGIIDPFFITGISQLLFPDKANGSFIIRDNQIKGSKFIGQQFTEDEYFWPRPSAIAYNPIPSGGSNYGMTSKILKEISDSLKLQFIVKNKLLMGTAVPAEMIYASASGLDPHISVKAAKLQAKRVAIARGTDEKSILELIDNYKENRQFLLLGEPRINVLLLNIELDKQISIKNQ